MVEEERVAVGLGLGHLTGAERAARAADVLHQHLWPSSLVMVCAIRRVTVSVGPPAENGTTIVIGCVG